MNRIKILPTIFLVLFLHVMPSSTFAEISAAKIIYHSAQAAAHGYLEWTQLCKNRPWHDACHKRGKINGKPAIVHPSGKIAIVLNTNRSDINPNNWPNEKIIIGSTNTQIPQAGFIAIPYVNTNPLLFKWSYAGRIRGKHCVQINEPSLGNDGSSHTWGDNYLCSNKNYGIRWSFAGPIRGMRCVNLHESASPHTWGDNYLCIPSSSPIHFSWSSAGPIRGKRCVQINEPADPHTWNDNYLCY